MQVLNAQHRHVTYLKALQLVHDAASAGPAAKKPRQSKLDSFVSPAAPQEASTSGGGSSRQKGGRASGSKRRSGNNDEGVSQPALFGMEFPPYKLGSLSAEMIRKLYMWRAGPKVQLQVGWGGAAVASGIPPQGGPSRC